VTAYIRSVMNNSMSNTVIIEFSKHNKSYRNCLDLHLFVRIKVTNSMPPSRLRPVLCGCSEYSR